jgi:phenylalanyl-tRNA synthetase beta chain
MRVPLSWLREFVPVTLSPEELSEKLTSAGLEVSAIERIGDFWDKETVLVGRVTAVRPHPNADRLKLVDIDHGGGRSITVVTGAPNLTVGQGPVTIALALVGATLWDTHVDPPKLSVLKPAKLRGVESSGMVCSERELGISEEHGGIMILPDDAPAGMPLVDLLGDTVLTLELTPNLGHCLSIAGIAREVAAHTGVPFSLPAPVVPFSGAPASDEVEIAILEPSLCSRYCGIVIEGAKVAPSPFPIAWRLKLAGQRPISNIVDITNYVMFERGQPLHAFDLATIGRGTSGRRRIEVRLARAGEPLTTLDGAARTLTAGNLVIADPDRAVALAGVMGGQETEVTDGTTAILLEAATFDPISVFSTSRTLRLPSQASLRFAKGVWPELAEEGALRAAELFVSITGGTVRRGIVQDYPRPRSRPVITLPKSETKRILGLDLPAETVTGSLASQGFEVADSGESLLVTPPVWRLDCTIPADLLEEVARLYGYGNLPERLMEVALPPTRRKSAPPIREMVRDRMVRLGYWEIITHAMVSPEEVAAFGFDPADAGLLRLLNPLSRERSVLRPTLLITMLLTLAANFRYRDRLAHAEVGKVFARRDGAPWEEDRLALGIGGPRRPLWWGWGASEPSDLYDLKGSVEALLQGEGITGWSFRPGAAPGLRSGRTLEVMLGEEVVGILGEVDERLTSFFGLPETPVAVAEISLAPLAAAVGPKRFVPPLRYPPAVIDLALVVPETRSSSEVVLAIRGAAGPLLRELTPFDLYRGPQLPEGHRSVAFRMLFQSPERSLTDAEILASRDAVLLALEPLGIRIR